jgi:UDP-N-acetylmuramyl pentapeptide phosphotransferase/UDP-N-acetylglucosamine-1-phosphate transferase
MTSNRLLSWTAVGLGIVLIAVAIMYLTVPPKSLPVPGFLGHEDSVSSVHIKHGIASFLLALACFAFAWFNLGPKKTTA